MKPTALASPDCRDNESCPQSVEAANNAVYKVFAILGVDVNDPSEVEDFRRDLRVAGTIRRAVDKGLSAAFVAIVLGLLAALCLGLRSKIGLGDL